MKKQRSLDRLQSMTRDEMIALMSGEGGAWH